MLAGRVRVRGASRGRLLGMHRKYRLSFKIPTTLPANTYVLVAVLDPANTLNDPNLTNNVIVGSTQFTVA
jgi:hypothetical protein